MGQSTWGGPDISLALALALSLFFSISRVAVVTYVGKTIHPLPPTVGRKKKKKKKKKKARAQRGAKPMGGKSNKGPCCHCGSVESVMWRKGPADKPVLCNPCGARWIAKKTLEGYLPQSAGGRKASTSKRSRAAAGTTSSSARQKKPREQRKPPAAPRESETLVLSSKRVRRVPQKYIDSSNGGAKTTKPKRKGLKIELVDKGMKSMDRIPSPQKPAKKRHTVRNLFVDDLASPRTTLPPKKKKHDVLLSFPYMKRTVLKTLARRTSASWRRFSRISTSRKQRTVPRRSSTSQRPSSPRLSRARLQTTRTCSSPGPSILSFRLPISGWSTTSTD